MPRILRYLAAIVLTALTLVVVLGTGWLAILLLQATNMTAGVALTIVALILAALAGLLVAKLLRNSRAR